MFRIKIEYENSDGRQLFVHKCNSYSIREADNKIISFKEDGHNIETHYDISGPTFQNCYVMNYDGKTIDKH